MQASILKNYLYNLSYQLLLIFAPLITLPVASRALGPTNLGIYEYTFAVSQYFVIFATVGLNLYSQRAIARARGNSSASAKIFWELVVARLALVGLALLPFVGVTLSSPTYRLYYAILLINIIAAGCDISWLYQGREDFRTVLIRGGLVKLLSIALIVAFVRTPDDLAIYFLFQIAPLLIGNVLLWILLRPLPKGGRVSLRSVLGHIRAQLPLAITQFLITFYTILPRLLIKTLFPLDTEAEVAYFGVADRVVRMTMTLITAIGLVMLSRSATLFQLGHHEQLRDGIYRSVRFAQYGCLPLACLLAASAPSLVPWFLGPGYAPVAPTIAVLSPIIVLVGLSNAIGTQFMIATGMERQFTVAIVLGAACGLGAALVAIPRLGSVGGAVSVLCAEIAVTAAQCVAVRKQLSLRRALRPSALYAPAAALGGVATWGLGFLAQPSLWLTCVQAVAGGVLYLAILRAARDEMLMLSIERLRGVLR
ncbi:MAG: oligosaccharide flippase family protein [Bifidobacteriaceae bacterium]|jgi:O-antigen/teichoic acid export membrane protein|nr:oligosaccharide flippase family protein [Bifidobacteriaceae bacterium]